MALITIDGHPMTDEPQKFVITPMEIGTSKRLASGRLVTDIVCIKKKFTISWPFLKYLYLQHLIAIWEASDFVTMLYPDKGVLGVSATVKITDIGPEDLRLVETSADDWLFENMTVTLEEQ